ncbi:MAG: hypothetical protein WKH64_07035 [Chloroflexia bacterium]
MDLDAIVTGHFSLDETTEALTAATTDQASVKPIVNPTDVYAG